MPRAIILPSAEADLAEIWEYIARDSPRNADRFIHRIYQTCQNTLASNPPIGRTREELSPTLRSLVVQDYVIFYRPIEDGVEVIRVIHGRRDIGELFEP